MPTQRSLTAVAPRVERVEENPAREPSAIPIRVGYVVNQYPRTSHSFIRREIRALERLGFQVERVSIRSVRHVAKELVTPDDRDELQRTSVILDRGAAGHLAAAGAVALTRPRALARAAALALRVGWRSDRGLLRHVAYLAEACVLQRWAAREGLAHLHAHFGTNSAAVAMLCHELGGPTYSFTVHGPEEFDKPEFLSLGEKVRRAAFAVAVSSFGRSQLFRWVRHQDWPKLQVVHCGVSEDLLGAPASRITAAAKLVCVARISEQKGHLLLVEAAARLAAEGVDFELLLAGDGPLRGNVEELIRNSGLERRVRIGGWMSAAQVREAILGARALVLPSFAEGLPVVIMEALALGRPVITTAIAGTPELVQPGVTGWLVPAGSVDALVGAMREALRTSPSRLEEMGRAGAAIVSAQHDASREAQKLAALFQDAIARARRDGSARSPRPA